MGRKKDWERDLKLLGRGKPERERKREIEPEGDLRRERRRK